MWYKSAVFYELSVRSFFDSNGDGIGDLSGLIQKLDYVQSLGVECIWILPHYPSPLCDDGYDVSDYRGVHPDLGSIDDFKRLIQEAHARGLRVVTDLVINHTSDQHFWFQEARKDPLSPYRDYYVWSQTGKEYAGIRNIFPDYEPSCWTYDEIAQSYYWHRFYRSQPDLNYDCPKVHEEVIDIVRYWLDMGVDGFRLDAVIYLYEREGTDGAGLPETHDFLKKLRSLIDAEYPDRILIAEANDWPQKLRRFFGDEEGDECHLCFHFPLMPRLYLALHQQDKQSLLDILAQTPELPANAQWLTFLRNHDELTLEMVTEEESAELYAKYAPDPRMKINNGIRRRLAPLLDRDIQQYTLLNSLLISLPGTPIVYYGDEIGMGDNIELEDRFGVRTPMQWNGQPQAGFSSAETTYLPVNPEYQLINVANQEEIADSFLNTTRHLIRTRQSLTALKGGTMRVVDTGNKDILAYWREIQGEDVICVFNLSDQDQVIKFDFGDRIDRLGHPFDGKMLKPYASHWLVRREF